MSLHRRAVLGMLAGGIASGQPVRAPSKAATGSAAQRFCRVIGWTSDSGAVLTPAGLKAEVEGAPSRVLRVRGPSSDLLILILVDLTGDLALADPARESLMAQVKQLPKNAWAGLLNAQDGLRVLVDPTPDRGAVIGGIQSLAVSGRAGLLDSFEPAAAVASRILHRSPVRTAILAVSDSNIYNYREDYTNPVINPSDARDLSRRFPEALIREKTAKLAATVATHSTPHFVLHLAFLRDRLNEAYQTGIQQIAEATFGAASFCRTPGEIPGSMDTLLAKITTHWAVDVELPERVPREFGVRLEQEGVELSYRTRFTRPNLRPAE